MHDQGAASDAKAKGSQAVSMGLQLPGLGQGDAGSEGTTPEVEARPLSRASTNEGSSVSGSGPESDEAEADWADTAVCERRYEPLDIVGSGVFGTVFAALDRETDERVALKQLRLDDVQGDGVPAHVIREVSLLRDFNHPNIVRLMDLRITGVNEYQLIFEYVPEDLYQVLKAHRREGTKLPMDRVVRYSHQLLSGVHACHVRLIMHRDLKPQNVLIHPVDGLKICDFGLARHFSVPAKSYTRDVVTLWYRGPELLLGHPQYGPEVDNWSAGCIIAEMATGCPTFPGDSEIATIFKIMQLLGTPTCDTWPGFEETLAHWSPAFPKWPPTGLRSVYEKRPELGEAGMDLVRSLLTMNPAARLSSRRAKSHAFFLAPVPGGRAL